MEVKLPDVCRIQYGFAFDSAKFSTATGIPLIRIRDVVRGYSETYTTEECSEEYFVNDGDLLVGMDGEFNIARWQGGRALLNQRVCRLIPNQQIDKGYLFYFMPQALKKIEEQTPFVTVKHLSAKQLNSISIPLPELGEQQHIATVLDKISGLISFRKQQLAKLDELVKARFVEMFGDPVQNDKGWQINRLEEVCSKLTDGTHFSPENLPIGDYKYITAKNIKRDGLDLTNITYVSKSIHDEIYNRCNPELGDVLYIKDGVTTGIAIINPLEEPFTLLSSVALLKQNRSIILGEYLCGVLNNQSMYDGIRANMGGAAITRLTVKKLCDIAIPVAPLGLQEKFAEFVTQIKKQKLTIQQGLDKLEMLKKALMQEYFE